MDRDTLMDDLDLILERSQGELPGEWDWEPPLGMGAPVAISAAEPPEFEETDTGASSDGARYAVDGPEDEADDEAEDEEENEDD
jgi:hypothetical protein